MYDMTGKNCLECSKGYYKETSINDDRDGVLHCGNCDHCVPRYLYSDKSSLYNEAYQKGYEKGMEQARGIILKNLKKLLDNMEIGD
jgi:hypothetical protein